MNKHKLTATLVTMVVILLTIACSGKNKKPEKEELQMAPSVIEVSIGGMTCLGCEQTIQHNIGKLEGVKSVKASFTVGNAIVEYLPGKVDSLKIKEAVIGCGYTVNKFITAASEPNAK